MLNLAKLRWSLFLAACFSFQAIPAPHLMRSIWSCFVPCVASDAPGTPLGYLQISYCATDVLSMAMIDSLTPLCRIKTQRPDAVAARTEPANVASCVSSANQCSKEGLVLAGFTCNFTCPSQGKEARKFTACASTADEAWSLAVGICKDAVRPNGTFTKLSETCVADGQTPCE